VSRDQLLNHGYPAMTSGARAPRAPDDELIRGERQQALRLALRLRRRDKGSGAAARRVDDQLGRTGIGTGRRPGGDTEGVAGLEDLREPSREPQVFDVVQASCGFFSGTCAPVPRAARKVPGTFHHVVALEDEAVSGSLDLWIRAGETLTVRVPPGAERAELEPDRTPGDQAVVDGDGGYAVGHRQLFFDDGPPDLEATGRHPVSE
jgi:hypothetical protein